MDKVRINLILIDAVSAAKGPTHGQPITSLPTELDEKLFSLTNYYQKDGDLHGDEITLGPNSPLSEKNENLEQKETKLDAELNGETFQKFADGFPNVSHVGRTHLAIDNWLVDIVANRVKDKLAGK